jgi:hypothetical protein
MQPSRDGTLSDRIATQEEVPMKTCYRVALLCASVMVFSAMTGCSSGVTIIKPVDVNSKLGVVAFTDCDQSKDSSLNCEGSGKKVADVYATVFGAPVITQTEASQFDVVITGKVLEYNEAVPMAFRPNLSYVDLKLVDKGNNVMATQKKVETQSNVFGSAKSCSTDLAKTFKSELGR